MWGGHEGMGWWMVIGSLWFMVFWAAIIYGASRRFDGDKRSAPNAETPLEIVERRYASGEIGREEFEILRRDLEKPVP